MRAATIVLLAAAALMLPSCTTRRVYQVSSCTIRLSGEAGPIERRPVEITESWFIFSDRIHVLAPIETPTVHYGGPEDLKRSLAKQLLADPNTFVLWNTGGLHNFNRPHMDALASLEIRGIRVWIVSLAPLIVAPCDSVRAECRPRPMSQECLPALWGIESDADRRIGMKQTTFTWENSRHFELYSEASEHISVSRLALWQPKGPDRGWRWLDLPEPESLASIINTPPSALVARIDDQ